MIVWSIIWTLINRGEINSLNLRVQSGIKPRIHRNTFFYPPPLRHRERKMLESKNRSLPLSILDGRRDAPSSPPPSPPPTVLTLNPILL